MLRPGKIVAVVFLGIFALSRSTAAKEIGPEANLCAEINSLAPGEALVLRPGEYRGPCRIHRSGAPGAPIVIEAQSLSDRPRLVYEGQTSNVLEIRADHIVLRGLKLGPTRRNIDGIRIFSQAGVTIEDCEFSHLGGIAIAATHTSVNGLTVRRNVVTDSTATAMYFGCHNGSECQISNLFVERNFIRGVDAPEPEVGYGIQVKLNSFGFIRDNVIADTKGPGIMIYGAQDPTKISVVERNFVTESRRSSGILIGGGPALLRNNIAAHNSDGGIALQDYGERGLLRHIHLLNNTSFRNGQGEFLVPESAKVFDAVFSRNAAAGADGRQALPRSKAGIKLLQNVDCSASACFANPGGFDFSPLPSSRLFQPGKPEPESSPRDDYFGRSRNGAAVAGAVALPAPGIKLGIKGE